MTGRVWSVRIPAPIRMRSINGESSSRARSRDRKTWRETAYGRMQPCQIPKGLERIRIDLVLRFPSHARRDEANYHPTIAKPIVDAIGPGRSYWRDRVKVTGRGLGIIADDSSGFLHCPDCPHIRFGDPVPADPRWPFGLVEVTITDLTGGEPCLP